MGLHRQIGSRHGDLVRKVPWIASTLLDAKWIVWIPFTGKGSHKAGPDSLSLIALDDPTTTARARVKTSIIGHMDG